MAKNVLNLSNVLCVPILARPKNRYMWTGVVSADKITSTMIPDENLRKEFVKLTREMEGIVGRYRDIYSNQNNTLMMRINNEGGSELKDLEERILEISKQLKQYLNDIENTNIDRDLYLVELCRAYEEIMENNPDEFKYVDKDRKKNLSLLKANFDSKQPIIRELYLPNENRYTCYQFPTKSQEKKYTAIDKNNPQKLVEVIEAIAGKKGLSKEEGMEILREIVTGITLVDLQSIFINPRFAEMQYISLFKNFLLKKGMTIEEIEKMEPGEIVDITVNGYNQESVEFHADIVANTIIDGINYFDMEKLLLVSMIRPLETFELMVPKVEEEDRSDLKENYEKLSQKAEEMESELDNFIKKEASIEETIGATKRIEYINKKILGTGIVTPKTKFKNVIGGKEYPMSLKRVEELMSNFCDGIYMTEVVNLNLKYKAYMIPEEMESWSDEFISRMDFLDEELNTLSIVNFNNLKRLYKLGKINKEHIKNLIEEANYEIEEPIEDIEKEDTETKKTIRRNIRGLLKYLYDEKMISEEEIRQYFEEGIISPKLLETIEVDKEEEQLGKMNEKFKSLFNPDMVLGKYKQFVEKYLEFTKFQKEHPEELEKIEILREEVNKYRTEKDKFREIVLKYNSNISEQEKHAIGEELLEKYFIEMDVTNEDVLQESIKVLYEDGLIDLENIISLDKKYIIPMLDSLSLEDTSKVRASMSFKELEELLDDVFDNKDFSDERRFIIVMNLLDKDTEEDETARDFYLSMLEFDNTSERKASSKGTRNKKGGTSKSSNRYMYPDFVKWKFYKALDKDVRVTRYANGFVEFASNKLGSRIIEKYFDGDKPAYGTATYILSEQDYRKNQADLVTITPSGNILEGASLRDITPRKDRVIHRTHSVDRTWMDDMVRYFDIDYEKEDSRYTKEELEILETTVKKYKNKYKAEHEIIK